MLGLAKRYGFAAVVTAAIALMAVLVVGKAVFGGGEQNAKGAPAAAQAGGGMRGGATVVAASVEMHTFTDGLQALGTAQARESIVLTPKVADTIRALRFDSGDRVRRGQVLVQMSSVEQSADLAEARAANQAAQEDLRRTQELFNRGFASQARLDTVRAAADAAEARLNAGASRIADRTIVAPFAGIVGLRTASPGQYVRPGDQIGTLDDISEMKLDFNVPETQLARVGSGVEIVARTAAYPDRLFTGRIGNVDSRVDPTTRTVRVRAMLPNADEVIRPGMLMTVEVRSNARQAPAAPEIAIQDRADGSYVYRVAAADGVTQAELVRIRTGARADGVAEVLEGLNVGDQIVVEGLQMVRPGQPVQVAAPQPASQNDRDAAQLPLRPRG